MCFYSAAGASAALTVKQLKELCREHALKVTGTNAALILQLEILTGWLRREEMLDKCRFLLLCVCNVISKY